MRMLKLAFLAGAGMLTLAACSDRYYATEPASGPYVVTTQEYVAPPPAYVVPPPPSTVNPSPVNVKHYPSAAANGGL